MLLNNLNSCYLGSKYHACLSATFQAPILLLTSFVRSSSIPKPALLSVKKRILEKKMRYLHKNSQCLPNNPVSEMSSCYLGFTKQHQHFSIESQPPILSPTSFVRSSSIPKPALLLVKKRLARVKVRYLHNIVSVSPTIQSP